MTQAQIADATGLTSVHVNRVLQNLKRSGVLKAGTRTISIEDWTALVAAADFNPDYLESIPAVNRTSCDERSCLAAVGPQTAHELT